MAKIDSIFLKVLGRCHKDLYKFNWRRNLVTLPCFLLQLCHLHQAYHTRPSVHGFVYKSTSQVTSVKMFTVSAKDQIGGPRATTEVSSNHRINNYRFRGWNCKIFTVVIFCLVLFYNVRPIPCYDDRLSA
jgi:hypothetical protein